MLRVVLDTNVLLSGFAYPDSVPGRILASWRAGSIGVVLSPFILDELRRVLPRLRHRHGMSDGEIGDFVELLAFQVELVEPDAASDPLLRDANQQAVLGTLRAALSGGSADYLVTGDQDLLALATHFPIMSPAQFWERHGGIRSG